MTTPKNFVYGENSRGEKVKFSTIMRDDAIQVTILKYKYKYENNNSKYFFPFLYLGGEFEIELKNA